MSKHDARISKTKYIITMVLAILISLGAGVCTGYLVAKYKDTEDINIVQNQDENEDVIADKQSKETEETASVKQEDNTTNEKEIKADDKVVENTKKDDNTKSEDNKVQEVTVSSKDQVDISKSVINAYYSIDSKAFANLLTVSNSKNDVFKKELYKKYEQVLKEKSLSDIKSMIDAGSLDSYYFSDYFNSKRNTSIKAINVASFENGIIKTKTTITNEFLYYSIPNSSDFFSTLKGSGLTKEQYIAMVKVGPKRIKVVETRNDEFDIKNIGDKWYIVNNKSSISSTQISEVIFENESYTFEQFKKKYL